jgi:hypothetical protein
MTEEGWKNVGCGVRSSHPSAKNALGWGTPRFCGACKVYGSFVGSPWLCQGLRCLRMTAFRGRMRPFDNSCEDEAVRLMVSFFQSCHLERRERTRLRVCSRSRKTCYLPVRRTCRRMIAVGRRQKAGPSAAQDRPRADDLSPLGMTELTLEHDRVRRLWSSTSPTFRKGRERWGIPRLWWCQQSAGILRWESLALPRTPLSQDDSVSGANAAIRQLTRDDAVRLLVSSFQSCHLERRERARSRVCSRSGKPAICPRDGLAAG